jgi:hypothetical protein
MATPEKQKPASHAFRVSNDAGRLEYRRARAAQLAPELEVRARMVLAIAGEAAVVIGREQGYYLCPDGALEGVDAVVAQANEVLDSADIAARKEKANKPFMVKLTDMKGLTIDSAIIRFALRRDIVAAAARYLGVVPILQFANVFYSSRDREELAKSQLYHCDSDEVEQVKVFILCEEVTSDGGPLTFVAANASQIVRDRLDYRYKFRLTDDQVRGVLGTDLEEVALTGPAGTAAFLDTSRCLHFGSRFSDVTTRRVVVMIQYITPTAFILPDDFRSGATFRHLATADHDDLSRMVLGAS